MSETQIDLVTAMATGPIVVAIWRGEVTPDAVEEVGRLLHRTAAEHPDGIAFVTMAEYRAPIPSAAIRARIVEIYSELGSTLHGVAQVVEGTGFWASAAFCFMAGVGLLHRHVHEMKVFNKIEEACDWVEQLELPGCLSTLDLLAVIEPGPRTPVETGSNGRDYDAGRHRYGT